MKAGNLYELDFPFEDGQGSKKRPVLIVVVNDELGKVVGLKITSSSAEKYSYRIPIKNSPSSNLNEGSHAQYDRYAVFDDAPLPSRGVLGEEDFKEIVLAFKEFHGL